MQDVLYGEEGSDQTHLTIQEGIETSYSLLRYLKNASTMRKE